MLVGRDRELAILVADLAAGRHVVVVGVAGVGKTTLLRAVAAARGRPVFDGGGVAALSYRPYLPLTMALRREPPDGDAITVAGAVAELVGDGTLLLDDLQWADEGTLNAVVTLPDAVAVLTAARTGAVGARAADRLKVAGFVVRELTGLDRRACQQVVRLHAPDMSVRALRRTLDAADGNPLLLEQLSRGEDGHATIALALAARLAALEAGPCEATTRLALLARPAEDGLLDGWGRALVAEGVAVAVDHRFALQHALLGDAILAQLGEPERRAAHRELAQRLEDPGEAARHHAAAGEREVACEKALLAAGHAGPGERPHHLALAAELSDGDHADELRVQAARELATASGDYERALELALAVRGDDPEIRAQALLVGAHAAARLGRSHEARELIAAGLRHAAPSTRGELLLELAHGMAFDLDPGALAIAHEGARLVWGEDEPDGWTHFVLGCAHHAAASFDAAQALHHARRARERCVQEGDAAGELRGYYLEASALHNGGDSRAALAVAAQGRTRAKQLGLGGPAVELGAMVLEYTLWLIDGETALELAEELLEQPAALGHSSDRVELARALALADAGAFVPAAAAIERVRERAATGDGLQAAAWIAAELQWLAGRPAFAIEQARAALSDPELLHAVWRLQLTCTLGWACIDVGTAPPQPLSDIPMPTQAGLVIETTALARVAQPGGHHDAMGLFDQAATLHEGRDERSGLRCYWGAGECARKIGAREDAVVRLAEVESRATERGMTTMAARARRSLQQLGVRRPAAAVRDRSAVVSARERDVLQAVAEGLASGQIAARLGISRATVESHISSAIRRLGVRTRIEAAGVLTGELEPAPTRHAITASSATAGRLARRLRDDGWNVTDDFTPPNGGWSLADRRAACAATVSDDDDLRDALLAAARGALIVAHVDTAHELAAQLYEGLSRLGSVDVVQGGGGDDLAEDERRVLELLAAGAGRDQIADTLNLSLRTIDRRLARARTALGARSTAEAVAAYLRHR